MTISSLASINLLMLLGLAAALPAVVGGMLGIYFHNRTAQLHGSDKSRMLIDKPKGAEYMSLTEALDPSVAKKSQNTPRNTRPRKAA